MLLYLSRRLGRQRHGYEYAALEVKNYLEALMFSGIVSTVMITLVFTRCFFFSQFSAANFCFSFYFLLVAYTIFLPVSLRRLAAKNLKKVSALGFVTSI